MGPSVGGSLRTVCRPAAELQPLAGMSWRGKHHLLTFGRLHACVLLSIAGVDANSSACPYDASCNCDRVTSSNVCEVTQDRLSNTTFLLVHDGPVLISASVIAPNISITAASLHMLGGGCLNTSSQALFVGPGLYQSPCIPNDYGCPVDGLTFFSGGGSGAGHGGQGGVGQQGVGITGTHGDV